MLSVNAGWLTDSLTWEEGNSPRTGGITTACTRAREASFVWFLGMFRAGRVMPGVRPLTYEVDVKIITD